MYIVEDGDQRNTKIFSLVFLHNDMRKWNLDHVRKNSKKSRKTIFMCFFFLVIYFSFLTLFEAKCLFSISLSSRIRASRCGIQSRRRPAGRSWATARRRPRPRTRCRRCTWCRTGTAARGLIQIFGTIDIVTNLIFLYLVARAYGAGGVEDVQDFAVALKRIKLFFFKKKIIELIWFCGNCTWLSVSQMGSSGTQSSKGP